MATSTPWSALVGTFGQRPRSTFANDHWIATCLRVSVRACASVCAPACVEVSACVHAQMHAAHSSTCTFKCVHVQVLVCSHVRAIICGFVCVALHAPLDFQ